ncbi:MAG: GFA family protein, partial [Candidatus Puniceispirillales bacterium]
MMNSDKRLFGTCHCGAVKISVPADMDFTSARRCDCSFCRRRWAPSAGIAEDQFRVEKGADMLSLYQFNTLAAEHYFCRKCGIYTHH